MRLNLSGDYLINKSFLIIYPRPWEVDKDEGDRGEPFGADGAISQGRMMQVAGNAEGGPGGRLLAVAGSQGKRRARAKRRRARTWRRIESYTPNAFPIRPSGPLTGK
jgi:hypothetical protein